MSTSNSSTVWKVYPTYELLGFEPITFFSEEHVLPTDSLIGKQKPFTKSYKIVKNFQ